MKLQLFIFCLCTLMACTPKATEEAQATTETKPEPQEKSNGPCDTFDDAPEDALDAHVIYRDFLRAEQYEQAMPYWRKAFSAAPAADGNRQTHFEDGITFYEYLMTQVEGEQEKQVYLDSIFYMYDRMGKCYYADDPTYVDGRKAFDLYYNHRDLVANERIFGHFTKVLDTKGTDAPSYVINPFTALLVEMYQADQIAQETAVKYAKLILDITEKHADDKEEGWPIVVNYAPQRMNVFETVKGFFDCSYYVENYYEGLDLSKVECEELFTIATRLRWGGCDTAAAEIKSLEREYGRRCIKDSPNKILVDARNALRDGRYQDAIDLYLEYLVNQQDPTKLGTYNLRIAKIYYAHLKDFPKARQYARKAMEHRQDWGEPYMLIGKLYASSGPLCGPGRGWDSQIVTWPAIDMFNQARRIDPSVADEARQLINNYSRYMPDIEDIFQRQLQEGDSFRVGCWIQETTTIRAAPRG